MLIGKFLQQTGPCKFWMMRDDLFIVRLDEGLEFFAVYFKIKLRSPFRKGRQRISLWEERSCLS